MLVFDGTSGLFGSSQYPRKSNPLVVVPIKRFLGCKLTFKSARIVCIFLMTALNLCLDGAKITKSSINRWYLIPYRYWYCSITLWLSNVSSVNSWLPLQKPVSQRRSDSVCSPSASLLQSPSQSRLPGANKMHHSERASPLEFVFWSPDVFVSTGVSESAKTVVPSCINIRGAIWQCISTACQREK